MSRARALALLVAGGLCGLACTLNPQPYPPGEDLGAAPDSGGRGSDGGVATTPEDDAGAGDARADVDAGAIEDAGTDARADADGGADAESDARDAGAPD